jgi:hypothetical protein
MKKILLICISALLLPACADKQQYEQAVLANMETDQDIKDYNIDPEDMSDCVVEISSKDMPGAFNYDPERMTSYQNYAKMLSMNIVADKKKMLDELRSLFGSPKALAEAHRNYAESVMECLSIIEQRAEAEDETEEQAEKPVTKEAINPAKIDAIKSEKKQGSS